MTLIADRRAEVVALRAEGLLYREIAARTGISISYVEQLINDPGLTKARERKRKGRCVDCGTAVYSDAPARGNSTRCQPCRTEYAHATAKWNEETIIEAIRRWATRYGSAPSSSAWNVAQARPEDVERFRAGEYPHLSEVQRRFGSWSAAILAAGFVPKHKNAGRPRNKVSEDEYRAMEQMRGEGKTLREIAEHFGINESAAVMRLQRRKSMGSSLSAVTVLEREIARFEDRADRARQEQAEADRQVAQLRKALKVLTPSANGSAASSA